MAKRPLAFVRLANLRHGERRHGAGADACALYGGFEDQRVHDGRQHSHRVRGRPRQSILGNLCAAQNIAAAHHDSEPYFQSMTSGEVCREPVDGVLMDAEFLGAA